MKQQQELKSSRSDKFRDWLKELDAEKTGRLVDLERYGRLVVHYFDLTGDIDTKAMHGLVRAVKLLQMSYEQQE